MVSRDPFEYNRELNAITLPTANLDGQFGV